MQNLCSGKCLSNKDWKCFPTLTTTFALYEELNLITLIIRFLVVVAVFCLMFYWYRISFLYPAFVSAFLYGLTEFMNISSLADNCDNLNSINFGICLIIDGDDWILCWYKLFYCCLLSKDGMMSFLNSMRRLGNYRLFYCIEL